jgi:hypothetical protein
MGVPQFGYANMARLASTGLNGVALENGYPNILQWTAPIDGHLHMVWVAVHLSISADQTGGQLAWAASMNGNFMSNIFDDGGHIAGTETPLQICPGPFLLMPGDYVVLGQASPLTAGAATIYAEMWGK